MDIEFEDKELEFLEIDPKPGGSHLPAVVKGFRKRVQIIRAAVDVKDLYALKGNRFEKLSGSRSHQHSLVLTGNWRLIVEVLDLPNEAGQKIKIIEIVDYH